MKLITISKQFYMNCAHSLPHLPEGHKCKRFHGHTYGITIFCSGEMEGEWLIDYADIAAAWSPIFDSLDHRNLNEILPCITTAENLAIWIAQQLKPTLPMLSEIQIQETETSNVILRIEKQCAAREHHNDMRLDKLSECPSCGAAL